jgi:hypothetical protein
MLHSKDDKWITGYLTMLSQLLGFRSVIAFGEFAGTGKKATMSIF